MGEKKDLLSKENNLIENGVVFSIIIPFKNYNSYLFEALEALRKQTFKKFEIILLPDNQGNINLDNVIEIPTGHLKPADKRDIGAKRARGKFLAFIDDDAYPNENWLQKSFEYFSNSDIAMVCGPGLTPNDDSERQAASGKIYESFLVSGRFTYRYKCDRERYINDFPSSNMIIRKELFDRVSGFSTKYWPGEDTKLCLDIVYKLKEKILYSPVLYCYHHRRKVFLPHLKQVYSYAKHRGFFIKKYPENSRNFAFFVPLLFILFLIIFPFFGIINIYLLIIYSIVILAYLLVVLIASIRARSLKLFGYVYLGMILTHITYGIGFLHGLIVRDLEF